MSEKFLNGDRTGELWAAIKSYVASIEIDDTLTKNGGVLGVATPVNTILTQSEFDALPDDEKNHGMYVISDGESSGGGSSGDGGGEVYSTEETRIGTWIDGKPIYRRVFKDTLNSDGVIAVLPDVQEVVHLGGVVNFSGVIIDLSYSATTSKKFIIMYKSDENALTLTGGDIISSFTVIIEYTKTTD